jgi:CxxC motif-containing protein (DUF1111 family)
MTKLLQTKPLQVSAGDPYNARCLRAAGRSIASAFQEAGMFTSSNCKRGIFTVVAIFVLLERIASAEEQTRSEANSAKLVTTSTNVAPDGKELFQREWIANDPRSHGGDGLGPVFNDSSCVACHNLGGAGGGGTASKNVDIITAFADQSQTQQPAALEPIAGTLPAAIVNLFVDSISPSQPQPAAKHVELPVDAKQQKKEFIANQKKELAAIHPGFLAARSVVLHHFSTNEKYDAWRMQMLGLGNFVDNLSLNGANETEQPADSTAINAATPAAQANTTPQPVPATVAPLGAVPNSDVAAETNAAGAALQPLMPMPAKPPSQSSDPNISVQVVDTIQVASDTQSEQLMQLLKAQAQTAQAQGLQGRVGNFTFVHSRRNATALFGAGLIDKIPDSVLIEKARQTYKDFPEIQGRVAKQKDGTIGRFGWKDQKSSLYEFAMTACAVELGLDVPDHPQAGVPVDPSYKAKGHDLDQAECNALVAYLENLPVPVQHKPSSQQEAEMLRAGEKQFATVGCANCHTEKLGQVAGIYSDLLLHDMGPELGDSGNYGAFVPNTPDDDQDEPLPGINQQQQAFFGSSGTAVLAKAEREKTSGALRQEWRTPPLWGVRDSAPYLHDGRADTLEQAIAFHGGEGANSAKQYFMLKPEVRMQVVTFLKSLVAPDQSASAE